jgi:DMSO/TMAO reductase YedYZ molybdopterin-dependent catalytic subunit
MPSSAKGPTDKKSAPRISVGRRVFLGMGVLGAAGVVFGAKVQNVLGDAFGSGLGGLLPGGDRFRIYTVTGTFPKISRSEYRLEVSGLVHHPHTLTLDDLEAMPRTSFSQEFQCVTGWTVPNVHWEGVKLSEILDAAGVKPGAVALTLESYDRTDTESLTLDQARLPEVIVAYRMLGAPVTTAHGGPVRLYVGPMFGYKSLKWLSAIRVVDSVIPGYWELRGYPVDGWRDGSTGPTDRSLR